MDSMTDTHIEDPVWHGIRQEVKADAEREPVLASFFHASILNHDRLERALSFHLAHKLNNDTAPALLIREVIERALREDPDISQAIRCDLCAIRERDSACHQLSTPFLYYKGFHALEAWRIAHWLWHQGRTTLALFFQHRISCEFGVDIHPAAEIGHGVMLDHASGVVIGETARVGNNVSIMQSVTLGGTGKENGDRHPKIGNGVLLSAGAKILGNITIGEGAMVGAGSVVLKPVEPHTIVAGVPAKLVGRPSSAEPSRDMNHALCCAESWGAP